jgi:hypothetical protein
MYIIRIDAEHVNFYANQPGDGTNWNKASAGEPVFLLSPEDAVTAKEWAEAGAFDAGTAATWHMDGEDLIVDTPGIAPVWIPAGNKVVMVADGTVELRTAANVLDDTLTATVIVPFV